MGLQDRDYYLERQQTNAKTKSTRFKRDIRPMHSANQPPDLLEMMSRIPFGKFFFILVVLGCAGFFLYPML
ncbi:hypothetical protein [Methylophaga muralis]|jgi:hypothetical protein|uniref:Uncharacterized protein n=1 Tax=Methylophaga muralis TaxID=291169 RepID=A0A1E3GPM6_9GAMM|nr:hypothetical protein [Methylophaga muralis]ODN65895.1 hypothetical protein A9E74_02374 [Methylophaga muralis]